MAQHTKSYCYYLGNTYELYIKNDLTEKKAVVKWNDGSLFYTSPNDEEIYLKDALKAFYIKESRKIIEQRLKIYQTNFKVKYKEFTIEDNSKKWGTCSSNRNLTFYWKLIIFPYEVIDYVVVHELCHMIHMNHDRSFWRLLGKIYPNYRQAMKILNVKKTRDI